MNTSNFPTRAHGIPAVSKRVTRMMLLVLALFSGTVASAFYDPSIGRWINRDPISEDGGGNLYAFAENSPATYLDPFGLTIFEDNFVGPLQPGDYRIRDLPPGIYTLPDGTKIGIATPLTGEPGGGGKLFCKAFVKFAAIIKARKAANALEKLKSIEEAQQKARQFNNGKIINRITKSEQNAKKLLRDIANDPSLADDL